MYRPVCDTCGSIIPRVLKNPMITVEKLQMTGYKNEETLHFCNREHFLTFMETRV